MFTGLIQAVGRVASVQLRGRGPGVPVRLEVDPGSWGHRPSMGDSISVSGVCLTVAAKPGRGPRRRMLAFDVVQETLQKTKVGSLGVGDRVNLEHAVTAATLMGGHVVQGHVDGVGRVVKVREGDDWRVEVKVAAGLKKYLIEKGSVCVDGVSLTIARLKAGGFEVALIPTTLELTTLSGLRAGDSVNIEMDMMVKTIVSVVEGMGKVRAGARKKASGAKRGRAPRTREGQS